MNEGLVGLAEGPPSWAGWMGAGGKTSEQGHSTRSPAAPSAPALGCPAPVRCWEVGRCVRGARGAGLRERTATGTIPPLPAHELDLKNHHYV